ncbi:MAG: SUMF1/EgtB/PvdO family nonheme iron enzyme [Planctomycetota bacterium]|jgi:formylglycine-generating enzyme required for sulfatase activity
MQWENWYDYWRAALAACEGQPGKQPREVAGKPLPRLRVDPPATAEEVDAVEQELGIELPAAFREVVLKFSKCVDVAWQLSGEVEPPDPFRLVSSGGCGWDLSRLAEIDGRRREMIAAAFDDPSDPYHAVWHQKLAFHEVPNGDYLALDLASEGSAVVYLSHDDGSGHGYELGADFIDFVDRHSRLGVPGPEDWQWLPFTSDRTSLLDPDGERAAQWRKWFGMPPEGKVKKKRRKAKTTKKKAARIANLGVITNAAGMELALIPAGEFTMGSPGRGRRQEQRERPAHQVRITRPFYLGAYPVTQQEYEQVVGENPSFCKDGPRHPVENVTWPEALELCNRLSETEGLSPYYDLRADPPTVLGGGGYRLPTEAEWEYACRAGSASRWCFGDDKDDVDRYAWCLENANLRCHPVGEKLPNALGLYDVHGNVEEWCWDYFAEDYYAESPEENPTGPESGEKRVIRGGGYLTVADSARCATRVGFLPTKRSQCYGLRIARYDPAAT